jgi:hypothetical protein
MQSPPTKQRLSREEQLRIWLETKRKKSRDNGNSRIGKPSPTSCLVARKRAPCELVRIRKNQGRDKPPPAASGTEAAGRGSDKGLFAGATAASTLKARTLTERRSLRTPVCRRTDRESVPSSKRPLTEPRLSKTTIGSTNCAGSRIAAINRTGATHTEFGGRRVTRTKHGTSATTKSSTRTCPVQQRTPLSSKRHNSLGGQTLAFDVGLESQSISLSPMTCSIQSSSPSRGTKSPPTAAKTNDDSTMDVESSTMNVENDTLDGFIESEHLESHITLHRPSRQPLANRSSQNFNVAAPESEEDRPNLEKPMKIPDPGLEVSLSHLETKNTPREPGANEIRNRIELPLRCAHETSGCENHDYADDYAAGLEQHFDWRENLTPDCSDQKHASRRRIDSKLLRLPTPSPTEDWHPLELQHRGERSLVGVNKPSISTPASDVENFDRVAEISDNDNREEKIDFRYEEVGDESSLDRLTKRDEKHIFSRRRRRRRQSMGIFPFSPTITQLPKEDVLGELTICSSAVGRNYETVEAHSLDYCSPVVNPEKDILCTIHECSELPGERYSNDAEHPKGDQVVEDLRNQVKTLLFERKKLRDRLDASSKSFENRMTPFRNVFEEVSL